MSLRAWRGSSDVQDIAQPLSPAMASPLAKYLFGNAAPCTISTGAIFFRPKKLLLLRLRGWHESSDVLIITQPCSLATLLPQAKYTFATQLSRHARGVMTLCLHLRRAVCQKRLCCFLAFFDSLATLLLIRPCSWFSMRVTKRSCRKVIAASACSCLDMPEAS